MPLGRKLWHEIFEGVFPASDPGSAQHQSLVQADPVGPGGELALALEAVEFRVQAEQGFLQRVLGVEGVLEDAVDPGGEEAEVGLHQVGKGFAIPLDGLHDQFGLLGLAHRQVID